MLPVQSSIKKYFHSLLTQITHTSFAIPAHTKGRFAIVTDVGCGMRWTLVVLLTRALPCGRRSRVVLTPRRWRQVSQKCLRGDGGKQARSPGRARNKLLKPSRAGMPGDPGATVVTNACAFYTSRTRLRVQRAPGIPRSPLWGSPTPFVGRFVRAQLGHIVPRECESASGIGCWNWLFEN